MGGKPKRFSNKEIVMGILTVKGLIELLSKVEDKTLPVVLDLEGSDPYSVGKATGVEVKVEESAYLFIRWTK